MKNTIKISTLKQIIREEISRCLNEKLTVSMQREFVDTVHLNLGKPAEPPFLDDLLNVCERIHHIEFSNNGSYTDKSGYIIATTAHNYYKKYFPEFYQDVKKLFT